MKKLLPLAVLGTVAALAAGPAAAQQQRQSGYGEQTRRMNQEYSESLRKGETRVQERERVTQAPVEQRVAVVPIEDQFPCQGTDTPSGQLEQCDFQDEGKPYEWYIRPHIPISGSQVPGQLDPQEASPRYQRGPTITR